MKIPYLTAQLPELQLSEVCDGSSTSSITSLFIWFISILYCYLPQAELQSDPESLSCTGKEKREREREKRKITPLCLKPGAKN